MNLAAGELNVYVTIEQPVDGRDAAGGLLTTYTTLRTDWANVRGVSGYESDEQGRAVPRRRSVVRMRYESDVTPRHRILIDSRVLGITDVRDPEGKGRIMDLVCEEIV